MSSYRELFHRLVNADGDAYSRATAASFLESRLASGKELVLEDLQANKHSLASFYNQYNEISVRKMLDQEYHDTLAQYDAYLERRRDREAKAPDSCPSAANEMLPSVEYAKIWLANLAPTKLVDGSWLQHVAKVSVTDDFARFHAQLFRVFVDELGEGVLKQNHITAYRETLESVGIRMPPIQSKAFVDQTSLLDSSFECGLVQLCLSQFPESMLPEIIGYNAGYEQLPLHLMISSCELEALGLDANYFLLHVSIDNHSTGHAQVAIQSVLNYLDYIRSTKSEEEMLSQWQRILHGYYLNYLEPAKKDLARIRRLADSLSPHQLLAPPDLLVRAQGSKDLTRRHMLRILRGKSQHGAGIHSAHVKLFGKPIRELLRPADADRDESFEPLLEALAESRWIVAGKPEDSKFLQQLCGYGGKMFGIFTKAEIEVVRDWIHDLGDEASDTKTDTAEPVEMHLPFVLRDPPHNRGLPLGDPGSDPQRRVSAILRHLAISGHVEATDLARALKTWEVSPQVEIEAREFVSQALRDFSRRDGGKLKSVDVGFLQPSPSASLIAAESPFSLLELDGALLQDFFVPQLHATEVGETLLQMRMKLQDYDGGEQGEATSAMWRRILKREGLSPSSSEMSGTARYRAFLLSISRFPTIFTAELIGAIGIWTELVYGPKGLSERLPCRLSQVEKSKVEAVRASMVGGWKVVSQRTPMDWASRIEAGWEVSKRLLANE